MAAREPFVVPIALDLAMLIFMRTCSLWLCCGLVLVGCSIADPDDTEGGAGSSAQGGSDNGQAGTISNHGGTATSNGGTATSNGGTATSNGGTATSNGGKASTGGTAANPTDMYGDARIRCVDRTNELRATKGLGPIPRLASAEPCVDGQAKSDSESGQAHGAFDACLNQVKGWKGVAQNECPNYGSVEATLTKCLDAMWAEGPGGGHYDNMTGNSTKTACGFYTTPSGKVWMIQDFWTE